MGRRFMSSKNIDRIKCLEKTLEREQERYSHLAKLIDYYLKTHGYSYQRVGCPKKGEIYLWPGGPLNFKLYDMTKILDILGDEILPCLVFENKSNKIISEYRIYIKDNQKIQGTKNRP